MCGRVRTILTGVALLLGGSCRSPTAVELLISTDVRCEDIRATAITVSHTSTAREEPATVTTRCSPDGVIGNLFVTPGAEKDEDLRVLVVTAVGSASLTQCTENPGNKSCIVSRRRLRFVEHEALKLPVRQLLDCTGIACDETQTCRKGACVSAEVDPDACLQDSGQCGGGDPPILLGQPFHPVRSLGTGKTYADPCAAIQEASEGDVIEIQPGEYTLSCTTTVSLTLRGVGNSRPLWKLPQPALEQTGALIVDGNQVDLTVENLEFSGATTADQKGAGLLFNGRDLTVRNCVFRDNDLGLFTTIQREVHVESSEFYRNTTANISIKNALSFSFRKSWSHATKSGLLLRSYALDNLIEASRLTDETESQGAMFEFPDGGRVFLVGNLLERAAASNPYIARMGTESNLYGEQSRLTLLHNTLVNRSALNLAFDISPTITAAPALVNNLFLGVSPTFPPNALLLTNKIASLTDLSKLLIDADAYDYHPQNTPDLIDQGSDNSPYLPTLIDPSFTLSQYVHPLSSEPRIQRGTAPDIGAYELASP